MGKERIPGRPQRIIGRPQTYAFPQSLVRSAQSCAFKKDNLHTPSPEVNAWDDLRNSAPGILSSGNHPSASSGCPQPHYSESPKPCQRVLPGPKDSPGSSSCFQAPSHLQDLSGEGVAAIQTIPFMSLMKLL